MARFTSHRVSLLWHTARHLRPAQVGHQLRHRLLGPSRPRAAPVVEVAPRRAMRVPFPAAAPLAAGPGKLAFLDAPVEVPLDAID